MNKSLKILTTSFALLVLLGCGLASGASAQVAITAADSKAIDDLWALFQGYKDQDVRAASIGALGAAGGSRCVPIAISHLLLSRFSDVDRSMGSGWCWSASLR